MMGAQIIRMNPPLAEGPAARAWVREFERIRAALGLRAITIHVDVARPGADLTAEFPVDALLVAAANDD